MKRIGILSDTHGKIPQQVYTFFKDCDELWHAGDMGGGVMETLQEFKPLVAVYGNCDSWDVRHVAPETQLFVREGMKIVMQQIRLEIGRHILSAFRGSQGFYKIRRKNHWNR